MVASWHIFNLWAGVAFYVIAFVMGVIGKVFDKPNTTNRSLYLLIAGTLLHGTAIIIRWIDTGRGPYDSMYDLLISNAWIAVAFLLLLLWRFPTMKILTIVVLPVIILMLGSTVLTSSVIKPLPESYQTYWLVIHVGFAKLAYGSCLISFALAIIYIWRRKREQAIDESGLTPRRIDELSYQFAIFGFINLGIMIAAGAIWANNSWGRYWGWDPIETWALVSWLIYGIYLHLRRTMGWRGEKASWLSVGCFVLMGFSYFIVSYIFSGLHQYLVQ